MPDLKDAVSKLSETFTNTLQEWPVLAARLARPRGPYKAGASLPRPLKLEPLLRVPRPWRSVTSLLTSSVT
jgi:hypothetical protein